MVQGIISLCLLTNNPSTEYYIYCRRINDNNVPDLYEIESCSFFGLAGVAVYDSG